MRQAYIISESIERAIADGIRIKRGAHFDWTRPIPGGAVACDPPSACNATGSVLWTHGLAGLKSGQVASLCAILNVDTWWLYQFWMGFDRNYQVMILDQDQKPIRADENCKLGIALAKKYVDRIA